MFKSLFHEKQLIGPQKYTFAGSKSSQNASIFHEKNDGGVKFFIGYPYTAGYGGIQEYWCLLGISTERNLKEHMKLHDINQCYLCDKCDYKSPVLNILKRHKMTVHNENKFSCINCDYKATYELHLKRHVNYYHKEQRNV